MLLAVAKPKSLWPCHSSSAPVSARMVEISRGTPMGSEAWGSGKPMPRVSQMRTLALPSVSFRTRWMKGMTKPWMSALVESSRWTLGVMPASIAAMMGWRYLSAASSLLR